MSTFRVLVIGGGPSGLSAAHSLYHAGIDFIVLERRHDPFEQDIGASLLIFPDSMRILHQYGLMERLQKIAFEVEETRGLTPDGTLFKRTRGLGQIGHK